MRHDDFYETDTQDSGNLNLGRLQIPGGNSMIIMELKSAQFPDVPATVVLEAPWIQTRPGHEPSISRNRDRSGCAVNPVKFGISPEKICVLSPAVGKNLLPVQVLVRHLVFLCTEELSLMSSRGWGLSGLRAVGPLGRLQTFCVTLFSFWVRKWYWGAVSNHSRAYFGFGSKFVMMNRRLTANETKKTKELEFDSR